MYIDCGTNGAASDAGLFLTTSLRTALETNTAGLPADKPFPGEEFPVPHFIIGDDAFPLRRWLQKPYPFRNLSVEERTYNYRLSRARMMVECAFGILISRFRVFRTAITM